MNAAAALLLVLGQDLPKPEEFFGHRLGEDRKIVPYTKVVEYLERLDAASDRVQLVDLGKSTLGNRFVMAVLSTPANLKEARRFVEASKRLLSGRGDEAEARRLARDGKAIVLMTCNIHSTEIASSQTAPELAFELARGRRSLDDVILLLMPSINPDGQLMIQEWYDKYVGTEFEGGPLPRLYHVYAGHDNNRDSYLLNLAETRHVAEVNYRTWFPQVVVDHHQMGSTGARLWVPPYAEPLNANVHPLVHRWLNVFGTHMALDLERAGRDGVESQKMFEAYWPGATDSTPWYHNRIGILTESASCRIATPLYVDPGEATSKQSGVVQPRPWKGGWWRLRDIVDQQLHASYSVLDVAARYREELLFHAWRMARDQVRKGESEPPYAYHLPADQDDPGAVERLLQALTAVGVEVQHLPDGSTLIPLAQPSRPYVTNLFERQVYPLKERPYDVAGWTLPLQMGFRVRELRAREDVLPAPARATPAAAGKYRALSPGDTRSFRAVHRVLAEGGRAFRLLTARDGLPAGTFLVEGTGADVPSGTDVYALKPVRLGVYQPWRASMDEGWTRLVLEQFEAPYATLHNDRFKRGDLRKDFDAVLLPDMSAELLKDGRTKEEKDKPETFPPEFRGGIGKEGVEALKKFVSEGGTLLALDSACDLAIDEWGLPVRNVLKEDKDFSCPGSLLKVRVDAAHPLGFGMRQDAHVFFAGSPAFQTNIPPRVDIDRRVVARYDEEENPLASGYLNPPEKLKGRAALVEVLWGNGRIVLFGFRPQHRAQTYGTFKVLFNAILLSAAERGKLP
jgi:hypothetical protein